MASFSLIKPFRALLPTKPITLSINDTVIVDIETTGLSDEALISSFAGIVVENGHLKLKKRLTGFIYRKQARPIPESGSSKWFNQ